MISQMKGPAYLNGQFDPTANGPTMMWACTVGFPYLIFSASGKGSPFYYPDIWIGSIAQPNFFGLAIPHSQEEITDIIDQLVVDDRVIGDGMPGENTRSLMQHFFALETALAPAL